MDHQVVSQEEWVERRKALLQREKAFTRERDAISAARRELPWVKVEKTYTFDAPGGKATLSDLFAGKSQLIVYHFMFGPDWDEGCPSCSLIADHYNPSVVHLKQRDVSLVAVSHAQLEKIEAFKKRMGWTFPWVSSFNSDFNFDYQASFTPEEKEKDQVYYNFGPKGYFSSEGPGISVFYKDEAGTVYHTYSSYDRGLDMFINAYHLLDIVPKGRDEDGHGMRWVRLHDEYED
jgi:predicted dithiol-disulfide oxidoreductase (DUF899 family)